MRTNIVIDDQPVFQAMEYTKVKTQKEVIALALQELAESRKRGYSGSAFSL
jgi:Arc/MetJ family transcription regulator